MSTPTQAPPELPTYAAAPPSRKWFKKKRFVLPALAVVFFAMGASTGGGSTTATPTPAVTVTAPAPAAVTVRGPAPEAKVVTNTVTKTVAQAPAECGTALDIAQEFVMAVSKEHTAMGAAFTQGGKDGDVVTALSSVGDAVTTMGNTATDLTPRMAAANAVCRAAIK